MPKTITRNDEAVAEAVSQMKLATVYEVMEYTGFARKKAEKHITRAKAFGLIFDKERGSNIPALLSDDKKYFGRISELTIRHELLLSQIQAALKNLFTLTDWQQERIETKYVRPDAFFTLSKPPTMDFYLEADNYRFGRSDNRKQMLHKYEGYMKLFPVKSASGKPFRVLVVTTSEQRAKNLSVTAEKVVDRRLRFGYLFTTVERLREKEGDCFVPYEDNLFPILP